MARSSDVQIGRTRNELSLVKGKWSDTDSTKTHDWTVEWAGNGQTEEEWNLGGLGIKGGSRAGVIDMANNHLCGQLWGTRRVPRATDITV